MSTLNRNLAWIPALALSLTAAFPCAAARLRVPEDFNTVQEAVNAANDGDVISLAYQFHYGTVVIENRNGLEIRGRSALIYPRPNDSIGIHIIHSTNITINGFEIRNFERGVVVEDSTACSIKQMRIHDNWEKNPSDGIFLGNGVELIGSNDNDITQNQIFANDNNGIVLTGGSSGNTIRGNTIHGNGPKVHDAEDAGSGIVLDGGSQQDNMITGNTITENNWGILFGPDGASSDNQITRNKSTGNARAGIALRGGASDNMVKGNSAQHNNLASLAPSEPYDIFDDSTGVNTYDRNKGVVGP